MKLIDNVGIVWHRKWSVRLSALTTMYTAAAGAWMVLPVDWKPTLTHMEQIIIAAIGVILPALATAAPAIKQPKLAEKVTEKTGTATITVPVSVIDNSEHA